MIFKNENLQHQKIQCQNKKQYNHNVILKSILIRAFFANDGEDKLLKEIEDFVKQVKSEDVLSEDLKQQDIVLTGLEESD